jgi:hypothetical protein
MDYEFSQRRNKGKNKRKENKKHPYKKGGGSRARKKNE